MQPPVQSTNLDAGANLAQSWRSRSTQHYPPPNSNALLSKPSPIPSPSLGPNPIASFMPQPRTFVNRTFRVYADNALNRRLDRVGKPHGTHVYHSRRRPVTTQPYVIIGPLTPPHTPAQASSQVSTVVTPFTTTQPPAGSGVQESSTSTLLQPTRLIPLLSSTVSVADEVSIPAHKWTLTSDLEVSSPSIQVSCIITMYMILSINL